jgi:hypothetical protein
MSHAAQYHSDESDSEAENGYSDNEGIVFAESNRKNSEEKQNSMPASKNRAKAPKHDLDESAQGLDNVRLKKRRRTVEVPELPLHDEDDLPLNAPATLKFKSRIWNQAMVTIYLHHISATCFGSKIIFPPRICQCSGVTGSGAGSGRQGI